MHQNEVIGALQVTDIMHDYHHVRPCASKQAIGQTKPTTSTRRVRACVCVCVCVRACACACACVRVRVQQSYAEVRCGRHAESLLSDLEQQRSFVRAFVGVPSMHPQRRR